MKENKKGGFAGFLKKYWIWLTVIAVVLLSSIPLCLTAPTQEDFEKAIPESFSSIEAKRESASFDSIGFMTSYKMVKQIDSSNAKNLTMLGIV